MQDNTIHILCSTDDNFVQHCGVMLYSLFLHNEKNKIVVHVIEKGLSCSNKNRLHEIAADFGQIIVYHTINNDFVYRCKLSSYTALPVTVYFRLFISSILTDVFVEKILYLDCDVLVKTDLAPLFDIDMNDYTIAAVRDINNPMYEEQSFQISFSYRDRYFNSGVMLINMKKWRADNIESILIKECMRDRKVFFPDQDPLNKVFRDKWLELPPMWNRFSLVNYDKVFFKKKIDLLNYIYNPAIIHFASPTARPWMDLKFVPFGKIYNEYVKHTPWKGYKRQKVEKQYRYKSIIMVTWRNFLYRNPLLIRIFLTSIYDVMLFFYHIIKHRSLRYYSPYRVE